MSAAESVYRLIVRWPIWALAALTLFATQSTLSLAGPRPPQWCSPLFEPLTDRDLQRQLKVAQSVELLVPRVEKALFKPTVIEELYDEDDIEVLESKYILECPVCVGASRELLREIRMSRDPVMPELEYVITPKRRGLPGANRKLRHVFLVSEGFYSNGMPLYVDPSIRQFFVFMMDREQLEATVPKVFVGSPIQLVGLMSKLEELHGVPRGTFSGSYLSAHSLEKD